MVRDDFWMAITRLFAHLEIDLVRAQNLSPVDLFPLSHARTVLQLIGRANGDLPESLDELSKEQVLFVEQAVSGLAVDGKVVCVRLALFAEMMKGRPWTKTSLKMLGGTEGLRVTFFEETFGSSAANPKHRLHEKSARKVLDALLPEPGSDIKGHCRTFAELLAASGYADHPREFDELMRILDHELMLVSRIESEGMTDAEGGCISADNRYFQLTHDYLIPSLRQWLTRKQRETRRGRADFDLAETSAQWNRRPEARFLPGPASALSICLFSSRKQWTQPQRKMMRRVSWYYGSRLGILMLLLSALGATAIHMQQLRANNRLAQWQALVNLQQARKAVDIWLTGPYEDLQALPGAQDFLLKILHRAEQDYQRFADSSPGDLGIELERARIQLRQAQVFEMLDDLQKAKMVYEQTEQLLARLQATHPMDQDVCVELANTRVSLGNAFQRWDGHYDRAKPLFTSAIQLLNNPTNATHDSRFHYVRAMALLYLGAYPGQSPAVSESMLQEAITEFNAACSIAPGEPEYVKGLSAAWKSLGKLFLEQGRIADAEQLFGQAVAKATQLAQSTNTETSGYELRAEANLYLASVNRAKFDRQNEGLAYRLALDDYQLLVRARPLSHRYRLHWAITTMNLGQWLQRFGDTGTAKQQLLAAQSALRDLTHANSEVATSDSALSASLTESPVDGETLAICLDMLGQVHLDLKESLDAHGVLREAVDIFEKLVASQAAETSERLAIARGHLAQAISQQQKRSAADELFTRAVQLLENLVGQYPAQPRYRDELATLYVHWADALPPAERHVAYDRARELWESVLGGNSVPEHVQNYVWFLVACPDDSYIDPSTAINLAQQLIDIAPDNPDCHALMGAAKYREGSWQESVDALQRAKGLRGFAMGRELFFLAMAQFHNGNADACQIALQEGVNWLRAKQPGSRVLQSLSEEAESIVNPEGRSSS
jgi:tetratricopeptide (TPR) repeat protein